MIARVLLHAKLITLLERVCVYLEGQRMINIRPTSLEILGWSLTLLLGQVSAFREPCDTWPDTRVDNQHCTPSSVGFINVGFIYKRKRTTYIKKM